MPNEAHQEAMGRCGDFMFCKSEALSLYTVSKTLPGILDTVLDSQGSCPRILLSRKLAL